MTEAVAVEVGTCRCPGCRAGLAPFTVEHFREWSSELTLDSGAPWELEPFQVDIVADFVSSVRELWVIIPEGNAKTTLFAAVALYHAEHTVAPWVPIGAASRDQAEILFTQAAGFVERSARLDAMFRVYDGYRKIVRRDGQGRGIKVYAAEAGTGDGVIPTLALVDELHRHRDLRLYRLWKGKLGKRAGQLETKIVTMSTAGEPASDFEAMRETIRAKATRRDYAGCHLRAEGPGIVYHEWQVPSPEAALDLATVKDANPLSQITVATLEEKLESLTLDFGEDWLRLTCNIPTRSSFAAIPEADWDACQVDDEIPAGVPIALGADFAWLLDTTSLVPLWVRDPEYRLFGAPTILTPPRDGTMLPLDDVKLAFEEINERNPIDVVVMDSSKAQDVAQWLSDELGVTVVDREQTNSFMEEDYDRWMEAMRRRWIRHTGDPGLRRHVLNAIARRLPGNKYRFDRPSTSRNAKLQDRRVIDALTAAAMVHSTVIGLEPESTEPLVAYL